MINSVFHPRLFAATALLTGTVLLAGCGGPDTVSKTTTTQQTTTAPSQPTMSSTTTTTRQTQP